MITFKGYTLEKIRRVEHPTHTVTVFIEIKNSDGVEIGTAYSFNQGRAIINKMIKQKVTKAKDIVW